MQASLAVAAPAPALGPGAARSPLKALESPGRLSAPASSLHAALGEGSVQDEAVGARSGLLQPCHSQR